MKQMTNEFGQTILILILVLTAGLAIGISVVQRSLSDISTSSKVEQSSRAFSAAEAGIERALSGGNISGNLSVGDSGSKTTVSDSGNLPLANKALEYPPITKEELAHIWLAPDYTNTNFDVYFGKENTPTNDKPALEVTVITSSGGNYSSTKKFFDADSSRISTNGFTACSPSSVITNNNTQATTFLCKASVSGYSGTPILARIRMLYSSISQPLAVAPTVGSLPPQAHIFTSTGTAGDTQRKVQVFKLDKVVPFYFDYALFSVGAVSKN